MLCTMPSSTRRRIGCLADTDASLSQWAAGGASEPAPLDVAGQADFKRVNGAREFSSARSRPEVRVAEVLVDDQLAVEKQRTATQWIDFEVVP